MNIKNSLLTLGLSVAFLASAGSAIASGTSQCQVIYGGGEVCQDQIKFTVDKKVQSPNKGGSYVDNLSNNDIRFVPGNDIAFQITITNTGNKTVSTLSVTDTLPSSTSFVSGAGNYNSSNNTVTYTVSNLEAGKSSQQTIIVRVADGSKFSQAINCLTNSVVVHDNSGNTASDKAGFCVENKISEVPQPKVFTTVPPKSIPSTGPEMLPLLGLIPAGFAGYFLRRKSNLK